ncbi:hypothetical protein OG21DRAFT_1517252 [Imleria badia]|nr:hypothetical protein OG21DRAFT_1517252 [Imleria badia]
MIGIWIETVLYGVNCVMYGLCMFIVLRRRKAAHLSCVLAVMSTILFLLCTVHVGTSLRQLLDAFVYAPADVPNYSTTYWLDYTTTPPVLKGNLYDTLVLGQDIILIWRLYVVFKFTGNWRIIIIPIILAIGCVGCAYAASAVSTLPNNGLYGSATTSLIISAWAFGFVLNLSVTGAIVTRLWRMGRTMASLTAIPTNRFASSIYIVVESGAISAVTNAVVLALFASNSPAALSGMDVAAQLIVLTPLLIMVQAGRTSRDHVASGDFSKMAFTAQDNIIFREGIPGDSGQDQIALSRRPNTAQDAHV